MYETQVLIGCLTFALCKFPLLSSCKSNQPFTVHPGHTTLPLQASVLGGAFVSPPHTLIGYLNFACLFHCHG